MDAAAGGVCCHLQQETHNPDQPTRGGGGGGAAAVELISEPILELSAPWLVRNRRVGNEKRSNFPGTVVGDGGVGTDRAGGC